MKLQTINKSIVTALECVHADTCPTDYWGGHHLAHISIPIYGPMTLSDIKRALHSEVSQGAIAGNDPRTCDGSGDVGDTWHFRAHAAINRIKPSTKGQRRFFTDIEQDGEQDYSVHAYFVFNDY